MNKKKLRILKKKAKFYLTKLGLIDIVKNYNTNRYKRYLKKVYPKAKREGILPVPSDFIYEPTNKCNLNCKMCFFASELKKDIDNEMSTEEIKDVFSKIGPNKVILIGGECFMRPDFYEIIDFFDKKGTSIHLSTNGTMINQANVDKLLKNESIIHVGVSIDGTEEMHNSIRGSDSAYKRAVSGLKLVTGKIHSDIVCVITKYNFDDLKEVVGVASDIGLKSMHFEYERRYTKEDIDYAKDTLDLKDGDIPLTISESSKQEYTLEQLREKINELDEEGKKKGVKINLFPGFLRTEMKDCFNREMRSKGRYMCLGLMNGRIDSKGNVIPCFAIRKKMGNLREKSLEEIWNSEEYKEFRKNLLQGNLLPMCETCLYMCKID